MMGGVRALWPWPALLLVLVLGGCAAVGKQGGAVASSTAEAAQLNLKLGVGYIQSGRYEIAKEKLYKALEYDPGLVEAHNALGVLYEEQGEMAQAEQEYGRAVELSPDYQLAVMNYARLLCLNGKHAEGEQRFLTVIAKNQREMLAAAYTGAGLCARELKAADRAETYLRKALAEEPDAPAPLLELADLLYAQDQAQQARGLLQRYHSLAGYSPRSLLLGVNIAQSLGDKALRREYSQLLQSRFADSAEARRLVNSP
ncbi:MAG TPA: type IV pilus biogenesis/stability protein PilW [Candidatus Competibacteraceae bacterium]|nr:type IV pilus biogenesis/stability protein PilW [Candidatus Competibacteraceae bacterium]